MLSGNGKIARFNPFRPTDIRLEDFKSFRPSDLNSDTCYLKPGTNYTPFQEEFGRPFGSSVMFPESFPLEEMPCVGQFSSVQHVSFFAVPKSKAPSDWKKTMQRVAATFHRAFQTNASNVSSMDMQRTTTSLLEATKNFSTSERGSSSNSSGDVTFVPTEQNQFYIQLTRLSADHQALFRLNRTSEPTDWIMCIVRGHSDTTETCMREILADAFPQSESNDNTIEDFLKKSDPSDQQQLLFGPSYATGLEALLMSRSIAQTLDAVLSSRSTEAEIPYETTYVSFPMVNASTTDPYRYLQQIVRGTGQLGSLRVVKPYQTHLYELMPARVDLVGGTKFYTKHLDMHFGDNMIGHQFDDCSSVYPFKFIHGQHAVSCYKQHATTLTSSTAATPSSAMSFQRNALKKKTPSFPGLAPTMMTQQFWQIHGNSSMPAASQEPKSVPFTWAMNVDQIYRGPEAPMFVNGLSLTQGMESGIEVSTNIDIHTLFLPNTMNCNCTDMTTPEDETCREFMFESPAELAARDSGNKILHAEHPMMPHVFKCATAKLLETNTPIDAMVQTMHHLDDSTSACPYLSVRKDVYQEAKESYEAYLAGQRPKPKQQASTVLEAQAGAGAGGGGGCLDCDDCTVTESKIDSARRGVTFADLPRDYFTYSTTATAIPMPYMIEAPAESAGTGASGVRKMEPHYDSIPIPAAVARQLRL